MRSKIASVLSAVRRQPAGEPVVLFGTATLVLLTLAVIAWPALSSSAQFLPHAYCLTFEPALLALHGVSDALIGASYFAIPLGMVAFLRKRPDVPLSWLFMLFVTFIVACGVTHWLAVLTLWYPMYWLDGAAKAVTAAASVPTAMALLYVIPRALAIPSTQQLQESTQRLEREVVERQRAEARLKDIADSLEHTVAERTAQLDALTRQLQQTNATLNTMIDGAPVGLALWDNDLRLVRVNRALADMTGVSPGAHVGRRLDEVLPQADPRITSMLQQVEATGAPVLDVEVDGPAVDAPAMSRVWRASAFPIVVATGRVGIGAVCQEVTEQKAAVREKEQLLDAERAARAEAERANRLKDNLLASVSHELRTPLAAIMSAGQVLQVSLREGTPRAAADIIVRNARAQSRLVADLLDVARIAAGQLEVKLAPVLPERLIQRAIENARSAAGPRQISVEQVTTCDDALVLGDEDRLVQILDNLLGNAIKFSPGRSTIRVECHVDGDSVRFSVIDQGEGIDPEQMHHLFEPFRQASSDPGRRRSGLGLGLAICRRLAIIHGGTVEGESAGPGLGSRFSLFLPLHRTPVERSERAPDRLPQARLDGVQVLLVDDEVDLLTMQAAALRSSGAQVIEASSAADALGMLDALPVDVLVSDLQMPQIGGLQLIERWRAREQARSSPRLPAIALSGYARVEDARRARAAGFDVHLAKPLDNAALVDAIVGLLPPGSPPKAG